MRLSVTECYLFLKESLMTTAALSFIWFLHKRFIEYGFVNRGVEKRTSPYSPYMVCCVLIICNHYHLNHTSEKRTASISNTKARGLCLLCPGPLCISSRGPGNLLHIKNGRFGCCVSQNQSAHQFPGGPAGRLSCHLKTPRLCLNL